MYRFAELHYLLTTSEIQFDGIGISEQRPKCNKHYTTNMDLPNYNIEHCNAEGANGGALQYIKRMLHIK